MSDRRSLYDVLHPPKARSGPFVIQALPTAGKTTAREALVKHGIVAVDTDDVVRALGFSPGASSIHAVLDVPALKKRLFDLSIGSNADVVFSNLHLFDEFRVVPDLLFYYDPADYIEQLRHAGRDRMLEKYDHDRMIGWAEKYEHLEAGEKIKFAVGEHICPDHIRLVVTHHKQTLQGDKA